MEKVLAVFYEANRLLREYTNFRGRKTSAYNTVYTASGSILFRRATEDTVLNIPDPSSERGIKYMAIPKGLMVTNLVFICDVI